jgi:hypothetical protein
MLVSSPMGDFLLDCCFNAVYEGLKFRKLTPCYTNRLCGMLHIAELCLRAMPHSTELQRTEFKKKFIDDSALCNANFLVDYALCGTARSRLRAMWHSAELRLRAMPHCAESTQIRNISAKLKPNSKIF